MRGFGDEIMVKGEKEDSERPKIKTRGVSEGRSERDEVTGVVGRMR